AAHRRHRFNERLGFIAIARPRQVSRPPRGHPPDRINASFRPSALSGDASLQLPPFPVGLETRSRNTTSLIRRQDIMLANTGSGGDLEFQRCWVPPDHRGSSL